MLIMIKMLKSRNTITILLFLAAHIPLQFDSMTDAKATGQRTRFQAEATECRMNNKQNRTKPKKKCDYFLIISCLLWAVGDTHAGSPHGKQWMINGHGCSLSTVCTLCVCVGCHVHIRYFIYSIFMFALRPSKLNFVVSRGIASEKQTTTGKHDTYTSHTRA